ncbi:MAG: hypothetical protein GYA20_10250 [Chloroflexi bacterium]|nr:hypothetical protein [Chloroflexota bacterium]
MDRFEAIQTIITHFHLASCQIIDAKNNGIFSPEKSGIDWYGKGDGRFWPREYGDCQWAAILGGPLAFY